MTNMKNAPNNNEQDGGTASITLCPECPAGVMRLEFITYFTWLNDELITVPNFPAWVCDMCGRREFDTRAITWLNTLLQPSTGRSRKRMLRQKSKPTRADRPQP